MELVSSDIISYLIGYLSFNEALALSSTSSYIRQVTFCCPIFKNLVFHQEVLENPSRLQNLMILFKNSKSLIYWSEERVDRSHLQIWVPKIECPRLAFTNVELRGVLDESILEFLKYSKDLRHLDLYHTDFPSALSLPSVTHLSHLKSLQFPESITVTPQNLINILTSCSITKLNIRASINPTNFWDVVVASTPPEKIAILEDISFAAYGTTIYDDGDPHLISIIKYIPNLRRISYRGTLEYRCLETFVEVAKGRALEAQNNQLDTKKEMQEKTEISSNENLIDNPVAAPENRRKAEQATNETIENPEVLEINIVPSISEVILPWPQKDYTPEINNFIQNYNHLTGLSFQARNDETLALLAKYHGKTLTEIHLACTEEVTSDGISKLIQACPHLKILSLFFYDGHIWDNNISEAIFRADKLEEMWLGGLSGMILGEEVRICNEHLHSLVSNELGVRRMTLDCPNLVKFVPPVAITDTKNATELYKRAYPNHFIVRVEEGKEIIGKIKLRGTETVEELMERVKSDLKRENVSKLILSGKGLRPEKRVNEVLETGCLVKILC